VRRICDIDESSLVLLEPRACFRGAALLQVIV
jgi:hypothetical protein